MINLFLWGLVACGEKATDTSTTDTGTTSEPSSAQPSNEPAGEPSSQPSNEPSSQPSNEPSNQPSSEPGSEDTGDQNPLDDEGNNETNNSEDPPTGECTLNNVVANIESAYETEQFFSSFYWDWTMSDGELMVVFAGYKASSDVDICSDITGSLSEPPAYPQVVVMARPTLSQLPSDLSVGIWGSSQNTSAMGFMGDPELGRKFWVTEGTISISSIIEGEKANMTSFQLAELGEEVVEGDLSNLTTVPGYVQADAGVEVISCWCSGLADFYLTLAQVE